MEEKIRANIRKFREEAGLSQKSLGALVGKSESAIQGYEGGKTDIPLSVLMSIIKVLKISLADLERGSQKEVPNKKAMEIRIYIQEERMNVASILIKNGYKVNQGKRSRTENGKSLDYFLVVEDCKEAADTSR